MSQEWQDIEKRRDGNVDFFAASPHHLKRIVSSPQVFDNQWVPQNLLTDMLGNRPPSDAQVERRRQRHVRAEYIRALVNTEQVVINRAYLYNNPAIYSDYARRGSRRDDFKTLLTSRVVLPYLYGEPSPATEPKFAKRDRGWKGWTQVLQECAPTCLRLSWEDEENATQTRRLLTNAFGQFLKLSDDLEIPLLADEFGHQGADSEGLREQLQRLASWAQKRSRDGERLNREDVYKEFVVYPGSDPDDRRYDPAKPFASEIKQLADLRYNANLPDALGSYLLTPGDSLRRRALQEWRALPDTGLADSDQLIQAVSNLNFDQVAAVLSAPAAFERLTLGSIIKLRSTEEWGNYRAVLDKFLTHPTLEVFGDGDHGAEAVALAYREVIKQAGAIGASQLTDAAQEHWDPVIEITVEFAGAVLSIFYNPAGNAFRLARGIAPGVSTRAAKAIFHLVIGRATRSRARSRVDNSLRVLDVRLEHAEQDWEGFVKGLKQHGFRDLDTDPGRADRRGSTEKAMA